MEFELFTLTLIVTVVSLFLYYLVVKIELDSLDRSIQTLKQTVETLQSKKRGTKSISFINDGGLSKMKSKSIKRKGKSNG